MILCEECNGTGRRSNDGNDPCAKSVPCADCDGVGEVVAEEDGDEVEAQSVNKESTQ